MNFQAILSDLLKDPAFQAIIQAIIKDLFAKITNGSSPIVAAQQGAAQAAAAATFHLTGNPLADFETLVANLQPHTATAPGVTKAEIFTS